MRIRAWPVASLNAHSGASWKLFAALILAPDLSFAFYLFGPRAGAIARERLEPLCICAMQKCRLNFGQMPLLEASNIVRSIQARRRQ